MDRDLVHGIPVTSAARTLIDLAGVVDRDVLERAVESGLRMRLTTCAFVEWRLDDLGGAGRAGAAELRRLLKERGRGAAALESALEARVWRVIASSDLPRPLRQYEVLLGDVTVRLDFAWPDARVAVEADGYAFHRGRRAFVKDRVRMARLVAAGWRVIPVTWDEARDAPGVLVGNVRAAITLASMNRESVQDRLSVQ
jgi:very-short-patch-repair endonuclease